jgi:hypothetical protein
MPAVSATGLIDVACPGCGETYHLRGETVGQTWRCRNKLCGQQFLVEPQHVATTSLPPVQTPLEPLEAEPLEAEPFDGEPFEAEPLEAEALDAEALDGGAADPDALTLEAAVAVAEPAGHPTPQPPALHLETVRASAAAETPAEEPIETLPVSAIVFTPPPVIGAAAATPAGNGQSRPREPSGAAIDSDPPGGAFPGGVRLGSADLPAPAGSSAAPVRRSRRQRRSQWAIWSTAAAVLVVAATGIVLLVTNPFDTSKSPELRWQEIQEAYQQQKWNFAEREFTKFAEDFPEHALAEQVPYFLAMCDCTWPSSG